MSEQETRGANEAIDFNDELRNRREKLAAFTRQLKKNTKTGK